ncbi:MAG TPA: acVLRF1 family peptidyl-tRNA hydrolase [Mycobacteriales bacterium]|nr:acVLRF1 family peptidyl-tRNA hydrolase [Mycobacteriales bacterium]
MARPAAGGGRWIDVVPERLDRWLAGFDHRHQVTLSEYRPDVVRFLGADRAVAECHPPFPPVPTRSSAGTAGGEGGLRPEPLVGHALTDRTVGVLLVRAGGHAVGVFTGTRLVASKVGSRLVHGRSAAGGWSQHRFARRREGQLREAHAAAAADAARVLVPRLDDLDAVVLGGDRRGLDVLRTDVRLRGVFALATDRVLAVPDPRHAVLAGTPDQFRAVRIRVVDNWVVDNRVVDPE